LWSRGNELNIRQPGFCMPDMLFFRSAILSQQLQPEALPG
jgi:hypothetical protein